MLVLKLKLKKINTTCKIAIKIATVQDDEAHNSCYDILSLFCLLS